ncbi:hypothetical protein BDR04DRAFT_1164401 [Suillus decipiens]|nr:hypothetical protein BDR04DRAFT_1164401 [Suillus decipiens]
MPPKKSKSGKVAKPAKLSKTKAKVGALSSGISRAGPSDVAISSMVNIIGGPSATLKMSNLLVNNLTSGEASDATPSVHPVTSGATNPPSPAPLAGIFCHFCCDNTHPNFRHECVNCGAIVCEQSLPRSSGCIFLESVECDEKEFRCPMCSRFGDGKDQPLRYAFIGFGRRKKVKMAWPMAIVNLNLESMKDDYLASTVVLDAHNHYRGFENNLFTTVLHMRARAQLRECKKLVPGVEFVRRNITCGFPPNIFLVVDTHSDEFTGMLQHTGGQTSGTSTTITEILVAYLGEKFVQVMNKSSKIARSDETVKKTINGKQWSDLTPCARGGWRGLAMVSCGPAIRVSHHFEAVKALVENNFVDFVVAFGGSGTLPSMVSDAMRRFVVETGIFGRTDIWRALYREGYALLDEFRSCPTPKCQPVPADMRVHNEGVKVHVRCSKCNWKSSAIRNDEENKHFKQVSKLCAPQLFWHHFPPSTDLQNFFVEVTKAAQLKGAKGEDKNRESKREANIAMDIVEDLRMADDDSDDPHMAFYN